MTEVTHCQVVTTIDRQGAAEALATGAVAARLAACAQVLGPVTSTYWWNGALETAQEWQVIFKTTVDRYPALEAHITAQHTYEVPEILCTPAITGSPAYLAWIIEQVRPR